MSQNSYFLSCGSWSVLGVLRDEPLLSDDARALGLTNEARADHGLRPLFNITGLWILQELQRDWQSQGRIHDIVELIRMAEAYARGIADLSALTGVSAPQLNLVGGGSRNKMLCQLTADALGVPVVAGPVEASVLGSLLAQLEIMGHLDPADRNAVISATAHTEIFEPRA